MIFVIDVGNTNMTMGVFQGKKLEATFRIMTKTPRTSDAVSYTHLDVYKRQIESCIVH